MKQALIFSNHIINPNLSRYGLLCHYSKRFAICLNKTKQPLYNLLSAVFVSQGQFGKKIKKKFQKFKTVRCKIATLFCKKKLSQHLIILGESTWC
jgi:hypothetical protein